MKTIRQILKKVTGNPTVRLIACILAIVGVLVSAYWLWKDPGFNSIIALIGALVTLLTFAMPRPAANRPKAVTVQPGPRDPSVLVVGSAVVESILTVPSGIQIGEKQQVARKELVGGSGVNYTCRLFRLGIPVLPILPLKDDLGGHKIRDHLLTLARSTNQPQYVTEFIQEDGFFWGEMNKTPQSTILIAGKRRSIFTEEFPNVRGFKDFVANRIDAIDKLAEHSRFPIGIGAVMIGHIQADRFGKGNSRGEVSGYLLEQFGDDYRVFANFGRSQYQLGNTFWKTKLKKATLFQLGLDEAKEFFNAGSTPSDGGKAPEVWSLDKMMSWFSKEEIAAVITLERFGAVATCPGNPKLVYLAWPFEIPDFVDGTGAGDAFLSGLVSELLQEKTITDANFFDAIKMANLCAAYACREEGAANNCPTLDQLEEYRKTLAEFWHTQRVNRDQEGQLVLKLLDRAFS